MHSQEKSVVLWLSVILLMCCLVPGCEVNDKSEEANKLINEASTLRGKGDDLARQADKIDREIQDKDFEEDRAEIRELAQKETALVNEGSAMWREAAGKLQQAGNLEVNDSYKRYIFLVAQQSQKRAEFLEVTREQAEVMISDQNVETINAIRNQVRERGERLQKEGDELMKQAEKIREQNKDIFMQ